MTNVIFKGTAKWPRLREPDLDYKVWKIDVFLTPESWKEFKQTKIQLKPKDADEGQYVTFKKSTERLNRKTGVIEEELPPDVYIKDDQSGEYRLDAKTLIGNGSEVQAVVEYFDTANGVGHRLLRVFVDKLVVYEPKPKVAPETANLPF